MARPLRIEFPGAIYHVMNRGTNRCPIFLNPIGDRALFKKTLADTVRLWKIRVHAFSLMDNHYHLLLETPLSPLNRAMRHLDGVYTQRFNRIHKRDGVLFRGRYKALLVQEEVYFLQLIRYIHLNGVKALLYPSPSADPNCSHPSYLNLRKSPTWLTCDKALSFFKNEADPVRALDSFVKQGVPENIEKILNQKRWPTILGLKNFVELIREKFPSKKTRHAEIPEQNRLAEENTISPTAILNTAKDIYYLEGLNLLENSRKNKEVRWALCYLLRNHSMWTYQEIGKLLGISYSAVARILTRNNYLNSNNFKALKEKISRDHLSNVKT